jgi:adenine-specific DNA methylase
MSFPKDENDVFGLRKLLLEFIAEFADWVLSTNQFLLEASRALTQSAHEELGGEAGSRPLVVDPFAGGGSIPLEALRVGADTFASDLNPVAVLLNKVVLEDIPRFGQKLTDGVREAGTWIKGEAEKELAEFFPQDPDGATPIAFLWARTIRCEGPGCGAEVPLIRSLWLVKKANRCVALQLVPNREAHRVDFRIIVKQRHGWVDQANPAEQVDNPVFDGTMKRGSATCPCCGYTTPVARVREQLKSRYGGANDARLMCVVIEHPNVPMRLYRLATDRDVEASRRAVAELEHRIGQHIGPLSLVPHEAISLNEIRRISVPIYGMTKWGDLWTARQNLVIATLSRLIRQYGGDRKGDGSGLAVAVQTCLAMAANKLADYNSSLCTWNYQDREKVNHTFARQAIPMVWDFVEIAPFATGSGNWSNLLDWTLLALNDKYRSNAYGQAEQASATQHPLPSDSAHALLTDPPYYDAIPYSHLADFFFMLFRRNIPSVYGKYFDEDQSPKLPEIVVDRPHQLSTSTHDIAFYERELGRAFAEGRRVLRPDGICMIVFASKTTASWEAILKAVVDAGWIITGSWPIDTERESRVAAQGQARLASSVHLVCRPRENPDGSVRSDQIGDWRDVVHELPIRIHEWMPRLAEEGVVGADAIFACLGPALEVFSRYARVEKSNGDVVPLREYLEHVWAAVSHEALTMIFKDADAAGLEPDARLTAMWLWTLSTASPEGNGSDRAEDEEEGNDDEEEGTRPANVAGFVLEFDAARKIAQGLGIHLERIPSVVEVKGDKARLLPVAERTKYLFGKDSAEPATAKKPKKKDTQLSLFAALQEADATESVEKPELKAPQPGSTVLDRVHQAMILFAAGRGEALKRFLVEEGAGTDARFWKLAQSLSALYPAGIDEKRWVDGVLARKKSLGL